MSIVCSVNLDNEHAIYQPGQTINGRITLTLNERQLIKAFALKTSGYASTCWEKAIKPKKQKKKKNKNEGEVIKTAIFFTNRDDFISTTNYYIGSEEANAKIIEIGTYHYNFIVQLPANCPSSFESSNGEIRYILDAFIETPETRISCCKRTLRMHRPLDLRQNTNLMQNSDIVVVEKKSCLKFWQRPLELHVNIPQLGFIPGECLSVHVKVLNYDQLGLQDVSYNINLISTLIGMYKKKTRKQSVTTNILKTVHSFCGQSGNVVQHLQALHIPETPPTTTLAECRCIQIEYELEVALTTSDHRRSLRAQLPLTIGTISLRNNMQERTQGNVVEINPLPPLSAARSMDNIVDKEMEAGAVGASAPPETPNLAVSMGSLASSFREAEFMTATNLNKNAKKSMSSEQLSFRPNYVYYDMEDPTPQTTHQLAPQMESAKTEQTNEKS